jgi:DNA repair protein RadC
MKVNGFVRPRERLLKKGVNTLSNTDLLAILLGSGIKGTNVQVLATQVIDKFVCDLRQVDCFLWVLLFPPPIKLTATV